MKHGSTITQSRGKKHSKQWVSDVDLTLKVRDGEIDLKSDVFYFGCSWNYLFRFLRDWTTEICVVYWPLEPRYKLKLVEDKSAHTSRQCKSAHLCSFNVENCLIVGVTVVIPLIKPSATFLSFLTWINGSLKEKFARRSRRWLEKTNSFLRGPSKNLLT